MYEDFSSQDLAKIVRTCVGRMIYTDQLHRCPFFKPIRQNSGGIYVHTYFSMVLGISEWTKQVIINMAPVIKPLALFDYRTKFVVLCIFPKKAESNKQVGLILTISGEIFEFNSYQDSRDCFVITAFSYCENSNLAEVFCEYRSMAMEAIKGLHMLAKKTLESHQAHVEEWEGPNKFMEHITSGIDFNLPRLKS